MFTLLIFLLVLAILVLAHEAGHFIVARRAGVRVDEFGFGFPPRILGIYRHPHTKKFKLVGFKKLKSVGKEEGYEDLPATIYSLNLIPLGGFVKIKGEDGGDAHDADSFAHKKPWIRSLILSAGVLMNVVTASVLLSIGFMVGIPAILGDTLPAGATVRDREVQIIEVAKESPAEAAGVEAGDALRMVNGDAVKNQDEAFQKISAGAAVGNVQLDIMRGQEKKSFVITPKVLKEVGRPAIGVTLVDTGLVTLPWYRAIPEGIRATGSFFTEIVVSFGKVIGNLFAGTSVSGQLSGPVGIAVMTGQAARLGISYLLQFTALLSLNLALVNILPIPALDGGRLLFVAIEKIRRGKPVSRHAENLVHTVSFVLLLLLVILITAKDIGKFF